MVNLTKSLDGPSRTPWGEPHEAKSIAPGIVWYSTASHGGYWVSQERWKEMPEPYGSVPTFAGENWYEEDCDWCLVYLSFPEVFRECDKYFTENIQAAERTFTDWIKPKLQ